jgi:1-deoxy-D-xylulose-5-phosphate reductoisomerase
MRVPIAYGLAFPERIASGASRLDLLTTPSLSFEEADAVRFPGLHLSWQALRGPEGSTTVLNAANEVAVDAFLKGQLRFDRIHAVNSQCLADVQPGDCASIEALLELDARVRVHARELARQLP